MTRFRCSVSQRPGPAHRDAETLVQRREPRIVITAIMMFTIMFITGESCIILIDNWHLLPPLTRRIIWTFMHVDLPAHFHYIIVCEDLVLLPMDQVSSP
jgi:hypothetical protein